MSTPRLLALPNLLPADIDRKSLSPLAQYHLHLAERIMTYVDSIIDYSATGSALTDEPLLILRQQVTEMRFSSLDLLTSLTCLFSIPNVLEEFNFYQTKVQPLKVKLYVAQKTAEQKQHYSYRIGNCGEMSVAVIDAILQWNPGVDMSLNSIVDGDHIFCRVGKDKDAILFDPWRRLAYPDTLENRKKYLKCYHRAEAKNESYDWHETETIRTLHEITEDIPVSIARIPEAKTKLTLLILQVSELQKVYPQLQLDFIIEHLRLKNIELDFERDSKFYAFRRFEISNYNFINNCLAAILKSAKQNGLEEQVAEVLIDMWLVNFLKNFSLDEPNINLYAAFVYQMHPTVSIKILGTIFQNNPELFNKIIFHEIYHEKILNIALFYRDENYFLWILDKLSSPIIENWAKVLVKDYHNRANPDLLSVFHVAAQQNWEKTFNFLLDKIPPALVKLLFQQDRKLYETVEANLPARCLEDLLAKVGPRTQNSTPLPQELYNQLMKQQNNSMLFFNRNSVSSQPQATHSSSFTQEIW